MANLIGEGFNDYVRRQINDRQKIYGSGAQSNTLRTEKEITYLNSRTAWIKVASSVSLDAKTEENGDLTMARLRRKNLDLVGEIALKKDLAKKFVLFNGVSSLNKDSGDILKQRSGIINSNESPKSVHNSAYGMGGLEFGLQPMPGIISMDIEALNMGSLKKAIIKIKAYNKEQLAILDVLYLRLGYTLLVEFGNNLYIDKSGEVQNIGSTIIEEKFFTEELVGKSYRDLLPEIEKKRLEYCGNYDGFFGRITNFSWDFNPDGSYDIVINLYSLGDVIESLKLNQVNTQGLLQKYKNADKAQQKHMAARFKLDYNDENILTFLQQQERERDKIYEYLKEIQSFNYLKFTQESEVTRTARVQSQQTAVINDALQSSPHYGIDNVDNDPQIQNAINAQLKLDEQKRLEDLIAVEVLSGDRYVPKISFDPSVPPLYYKLVPNDPDLTATFDDKTNPPITQEEFDNLGGSLDAYKNKSSNYNEVELTDFTEEFKGVIYTVKLYRFTNSFIEDEKYVGNQIKLASIEGMGTDLLGSSQQQNIEAGFTPINFFTNGKEYSLTSLGPKTSEIFEPTKAIQTQGTSPRNRVPFPSDFDREILSKNNNKLRQAQQKIQAEQDQIIDLIKKEKSQKTLPKSNNVYIAATPFKKKTKLETIGNIINRSTGWDSTKLYKSSSDKADHVFIKKYNPIDNSYFIRFGTLLEFIKENILYKVDNGGDKKTNPPIFTLDTDIDSNIMYTLPNHISLDPTQAIVNINVKSIGSNIKTFEGLEDFHNTEPFYGKIMNIYLSHQFIFNQISANTDEKHNLILFDFLDSICSRLNVIFGGINNLHPSIDETTNCIKIYDDTPVPNLEKISQYLRAKDPKKYKFFEDVKNFQWNCNTLPNQTVPYTLNLYGYDGTSNNSNFVNNVKIATKVTKDMSTMLSIGATANGYVVGEESTAFSKWNFGMRDRYYEEIVDAEYDEKIKAELAERLKKDNEEIQRNYAFMIFNNFEFSTRKYYSGAYEVLSNPVENETEEDRQQRIIIEGKPPPEATTTIKYGGGVIMPFQIEENLSTGTSFYQYLIASASAASNSTKPIANLQGFLPITLDVSLDGISGPKIYQKLNVDTKFLPNNYPDAMDFIIRGVSHTLDNNSWSTKLSTLATSQLSNKTVYLPDFNYNIDLIAEESSNIVPSDNPYPNRTSVRNWRDNKYPIIVKSEKVKQNYLKIYGKELNKPGFFKGEIEFDNFLIKPGEGNPNSYTTKFTQFLEKNSSDVRIALKGGFKNTQRSENQLGNGGDIHEELYVALLNLYDLLGKDKYKPYLPITITAGNDAFHHGSTLPGSGGYSDSGAKVQPYNTTHVRGLALDIAQASPASSDFNKLRNRAIQDALWEIGFKGIIWHEPPHIHANLSTTPGVNETLQESNNISNIQKDVQSQSQNFGFKPPQFIDVNTGNITY